MNKPLSLPLLVLALAGSAQAQSPLTTSSFTVSVGYFFGDITRLATDVTIADLGTATYNRVLTPSDGPFAETTGSGTVQQIPWTGQGFDPNTLYGGLTLSTNSSAYELSGTARSSFGEVQTFEVTNHGTQAEYIDFGGSASIGVNVDAWGDHHYPTNYASLDLAFGVGDESDPSVGGTVTYSRDDTGAVVTTATTWGGSAANGWYLYNTAFLIGAGQTHTLRVYGVGDTVLALDSPVPEPASLAALGLGAVTVLRRRKRG